MAASKNVAQPEYTHWTIALYTAQALAVHHRTHVRAIVCALAVAP